MEGAIDTGQLLLRLAAATAERGGAAEFARAKGVSEALVSQIINGKQKIGPKVGAALGYRRKVLWVPLHDVEDLAG